MSGSLYPSEVFGLEGGSYSKSHGSPANTQRTSSVELVHLLTGITISRSTSTGHYCWKDAKRIRDALRVELFSELERLVATHRRISGADENT